ncbi:MAG: serine hydrolase [Burkholderiales bacterium PBB4]|nr:MAG: serine hydrolase [Burkholderiales bacterium PBB4]
MTVRLFWKRVVCIAPLWLAAAGVGAGPLDLALKSIKTDPKAPLSSLSVLAIRDGAVVYSGQFGHRRMQGFGPQAGTGVDARTLYRVASVSKLVTALGAMRLVDAGRLDLDADISRYLGFQVRNPAYPDVAITARMLLSHTSSLRDNAGYTFGTEVALSDLLSPSGKLFGKGDAWAASAVDMDTTPGRSFHYVNLNYGVLGTVMEAIAGERFDRFMQREVLKPLGMPGSFTPETLTALEAHQLAVLYRKGQDGAWKSQGPWVAQTDDLQGKVPAERPGWNVYVPGTNAMAFGPQGGLRTSVAGLGRVVQLLLDGGAIRRAGVKKPLRFLSAAAVAELQRIHWQSNPPATNGDTFGGAFRAWGLGTQIFTDSSDTTSEGKARGDRLLPQGGVSGFGHAGFAYGLQSLLWYDPVRRWGLVYAVGGSGVDPALNPGKFSSFNQWEERIIGATFEHALFTKTVHP